MTFDPNVAPWRKSSYSAGGQSECIEVAPWHKSTYSGGGQTSCVEVARDEAIVGVRDTKNRAAGHFTVPHTAWLAFTHAAARGDLTR